MCWLNAIRVIRFPVKMELPVVLQPRETTNVFVLLATTASIVKQPLMLAMEILVATAQLAKYLKRDALGLSQVLL